MFVYGYRVWDAPLDRTEPHRAVVAHQMVTSGQWLVPRLNGEPYLRKPPLIYWVEAIAEKLAGTAEPWVWRLPSVLGSAMLAVVVAAWAGRWFGPAAVGATGVAVLALVPLFDQDRAADIDALNTAAAVITALFALEIAHGSRRWPWVAGLALSASAMLLLKGPGGLPPVVGALVGASVLLRDWRWTRRPGVWVGLAVGFASFAIWALAAKAATAHAATDDRGVREGLSRLVLHRWRDVVPALLAPPTVLAYAVPVSLAAVFAARLVRRSPAPSPGTPGEGRGEGLRGAEAARQTEDPHPNPLPAYRERGPDKWLLTLLGTVAAGLLLFVVAGTGNPRYEYVLLPLLAMVAGGVYAGRDRLTTGERRLARLGLAAFALVWTNLQSGLTVKVWSAGVDHVGLIAAAVASTVALACWFRFGRPTWLAGVVVVMLAVPLADRKNLERQQRSTVRLAAELRAIVGDGPVTVASENWDVPELFHYAGVPVVSYGEAGLAKLAAAPGSRWVVLGNTPRFPEFKTLTAQVPDAFPDGFHVLTLFKGDKLYVGRYDPPPGASRVVVPPKAADRTADED